MSDESRTMKDQADEAAALRLKIAELQGSEKYFRAITQNSSDIIIIVDVKGTITYANPSVSRFLGYEPEELVGVSGFDLIMPADIPRAIYDFGKAILTKNVIIPNSFRVRHKDGSTRVLEGVGNNLLGDPQVRGFVMNVRDVTKRIQAEDELKKHREHLEDLVEERTAKLKEANEQLQREIAERVQAEEALTKSEDKYRTLVEHANDIIFRTDSTGVFTLVNPTALRLSGYSEKEIIGKSYLDLIKPALREEAARFYGRQFVKKIANTYYEYSMITKDDRELWIGQNTQLLLEDDRVIGFQAVGRDITDRRRVEEALRNSEKKYRTVLEDASDAILLADEGGNVLEANKKAEELMGYTREELLQMNFTQLHPKPALERTIGAFKNILREGHGVLHDDSIIQKGGNIIPVDIAASVIEYGDRKVVQGSFRDVSEQRRAKEVLEKLVNERTEELSARNEQLLNEIKQRREAEVTLREKGQELTVNLEKLSELNAALKVLLKQREDDRIELEDKVMANVKELLFPYLEELKKSRLDARSKAQVSILESNLNNIISPFTHRLSSKFSGFTPREIQIANLIRQGKSSKEIADLIGISIGSITVHRNHIRKKLGIISSKINLMSHLSSLP